MSYERLPYTHRIKYAAFVPGDLGLLAELAYCKCTSK